MLIEKNSTWEEYIQIVEIKISKNIGILYRASPYLDRKKLKNILLGSHVNYSNIE